MPTRSVVPEYRRHKGPGQVYVWVGGQRCYLGKWDTPESKERYARFVAELAVKPSTQPTQSAPPPAERITVVKLAAAYLDWANCSYQKDGNPTGHLPQLRAALRVLRATVGTDPSAAPGLEEE